MQATEAGVAHVQEAKVDELNAVLYFLHKWFVPQKYFDGFAS